MADRDITIPMGPDRTGELELPPIDFGDGNQEADADAPAGSAGGYYADYAAPASDVEYAGVNAEADENGEYHVGGLTDEKATEQGIDEVQKSFLALKDSIGQQRELKAREQELKEFRDKLDLDREELEDRKDILANYQTLAADQDNLIAQYSEEHAARKAELAQVTTDLEKTTESLQRMQAYHDGQMAPFEKNLGRARASADQAKNDERSRKSELNAAETELRRVEQGDEATMAAARHEQVKVAYEEACARSKTAKEALDQAQRAYDDALSQVEQAETPLEHAIEDLEKRAGELKEAISGLVEDMSAARKRRQYFDTVYQYPEETEKLASSVRDNGAELLRLSDEADALRDRLSQSKQQSGKAKIAIGVAAAVVVIIIILLFVFVIGK